MREIIEIETMAKDAGIEATIIPHAGFAAGFFTQFGQLLKRRYVIDFAQEHLGADLHS